MDRALFAAGVFQLAAVFTPAARVRLAGVIPFFKLPNAGLALVILSLFTILVAIKPHRVVRWVPTVLSAIVVGVAYSRISRAPTGHFFDPLVRRLVHPAWGFIPMATAILVALIVNAYGTYAMQSISTRNPSPGSAAA
ncbi:MAG: hypothetical protein ABI442_19160 [Gemmatimonadaceae bacterium]